MDAEERGNRSEAKALTALNRIKNTYPTLLRRVRRSSPGADLRGVDFFIELSVRKRWRGRKWMTVPVEVKTSIHGVRKWKVVHSEHHKAGVLCFAVGHLGEDELCWVMISAFNALRYSSRDGTLYVPWFKKLFAKPLSKRGKQIKRDINKRRSKRPSR